MEYILDRVAFLIQGSIVKLNRVKINICFMFNCSICERVCTNIVVMPEDIEIQLRWFVWFEPVAQNSSLLHQFFSAVYPPPFLSIHPFLYWLYCGWGCPSLWCLTDKFCFLVTSSLVQSDRKTLYIASNAGFHQLDLFIYIQAYINVQTYLYSWALVLEHAPPCLPSIFTGLTSSVCQCPMKPKWKVL